MIRVIDGTTLKTIQTFDREHTPSNVIKVAKKFGTLVNLDLSSDCLYIGTLADGTVLGFEM
jgi:hypothetical protein